MKHTPGGPGVLAAAALVVLSALVPVLPAHAETTAGWADWDPLTGAAGDWSTAVRLPAGGFPAATVTSDSRGGVGVISGASTWLGAATPPGEAFGPSRGKQYLNLRPQADRPSSPSTTTYTFEHPTPAGGWALVLGDIDADRAVVTAHGPDGRPLTGAELGWQGGFNYCAVEGSPSCTGAPEDVPTWDPARRELAGNPAAVDTSGAAGWFRPTAPVSSLTVEFHQRSGFPVYQTWFASLARDVAGTVDLVDGAGAPQGVLPGATLTLIGPDDRELDTTTSDESGQYVFAGYTAAPGYRVELTDLPEPDDAHPFGLVPSGERTVDVDLRDTDALGVDLAARDVRPVAVSGTVLTDDGVPVPGVTVTLAPVGGGPPRTAVTSSLGEYLIDGVPWDTVAGAPQDHTFSLGDLPTGYVSATTPADVTVDVGQDEPSTGNDFVVRAPAAVSGRVAAGDDPVAGAVVTLTGPGTTLSTVTAADGTYVLDDVTPGEHTVRVTPPHGYHVAGPGERDVTVGTEDVTGVDLALAHPGAVGGTVTDDAGEPVRGATVTVTGPDGPVTVVTDAAGGYYAGDLASGEHTVTLGVPEGYTADLTERSVTVTAAGESLLEEHFAVVAVPPADPTPSPAPRPSTSPSDQPARTPQPSAGPDPTIGPADGSGTGADHLAATGATVASVALAAGILVALGVAVVRAVRCPRSGTAEHADGVADPHGLG